MMVIYWGVEFFATFVECLLCFIFTSIFIEDIYKKDRIKLLEYGIVFSVLVILSNKVIFFSYITSIVSLTLYLLLQMIFYKKKYSIIILTTLIYAVMLSGVDFFIVQIGLILTDKRADNLLNTHNLIRSCCLIASKITLCIIILLIKKYVKVKRDLTIKYLYLICFFTVILITIIIYIALNYNKFLRMDIKKVIVINYLGLLCIYGLFLYLILKIVENNKQRENINLLELQNQMIFKAEQNTEQVFNLWRSSIHDYKHKIYAMNYWINQNDIRKLKDFIKNERESMSCQIFYVKTGNSLVDAIVNTKKSLAESKNINFIFDIVMPEKCKITDMDLVCLLGNLIDNAIEACEKQNNKKQIEIRMKEVKSCIYIKIINTYTQTLDLSTDLTLKQNKSLHGIGLKNVKRIVEKYNGNYNMVQENDEIITSIMISNL